MLEPIPVYLGLISSLVFDTVDGATASVSDAIMLDNKTFKPFCFRLCYFLSLLCRPCFVVDYVLAVAISQGG